MYNTSLIHKFLQKKVFIKAIPARPIAVLIQSLEKGFSVPNWNHCERIPLCLPVWRHWLFDLSAIKVHPEACYFSNEALLSALSLHKSRHALSTPPAHTLRLCQAHHCSHLTLTSTGFLLHWGLPKWGFSSFWHSKVPLQVTPVFSSSPPPNPDLHRHPLLLFPYDRAKGIMVNALGDGQIRYMEPVLNTAGATFTLCTIGK